MIKQNENMPKVSIIVPVYKAEKYLNRCIDSILAQTFTDWELLLIDDGSPDRSGDICDEYAKKDTRIRVFHKKNGGVSSARNLGLDNVQGEYVTFVDSDDWLLENTLTLCSSNFGKYEIVRFSMVYIESLVGDNDRKLVLPSSESKNAIMQRILERNSLLGVCGGLYKADLFNNPSIRFDSNLVMAEDWLVLCQLVNRCKSIIDLSDVCYCYNILNERSCSNNPSFNKVEQCFVAQKYIAKQIDNTDMYNESINSAKILLFKAAINALLKENKLVSIIETMRRLKREYIYPSFFSICNSRLSLIEKIALIVGRII